MIKTSAHIRQTKTKYTYEIDSNVPVIIEDSNMENFNKKLNEYESESDFENIFQNISKALAHKRNLDLLKILLTRYPFDISFENSILILIAAHRNDVEMMDYLITMGIDIDSCKEILFPIEIWYKNKTYIKILLEKGIDVNYDNGILLHHFCTEPDHEFFIYLISMGAIVNVRNGTLLERASSAGNYKIVSVLLENGLSPDCDGNALASAVINGYFDIVKLLVEFGANININGKNNPLFLSIKYSHDDIILFLLQNGIDVKQFNLMSIEEVTSFDVVKSPDEVVKLLVENNIDPTQVIKLLLTDIYI